jgi:hypothetical protein
MSSLWVVYNRNSFRRILYLLEYRARSLPQVRVLIHSLLPLSFVSFASAQFSLVQKLEADYNLTLKAIFGRRLMKNCEMHGALGDLQDGFRKGRSTTRTLLHNEIINDYKANLASFVKSSRDFELSLLLPNKFVSSAKVANGIAV